MQSILDIPIEEYFRFVLKCEGIKSPYLKIDSKHKLIHGFSFDREVVEAVVQQITTDYTIGDCVTPTYMIWYEFNNDTDFNTVAIALKMHFGQYQ